MMVQEEDHNKNLLRYQYCNADCQSNIYIRMVNLSIFSPPSIHSTKQLQGQSSIQSTNQLSQQPPTSPPTIKMVRRTARTTRTKPSMMSRLRGRHNRAGRTNRTTVTTTTTTTNAPVHHQRRRASIGDKVSGALMKLRGTLTRRPGLKVILGPQQKFYELCTNMSPRLLALAACMAPTVAARTGPTTRAYLSA
jgi:hypothetical protein